MAQCKFTLSPRGVAPSDTFRAWESLIVGSIPIIKKTKDTNMSLYEGLPVLFIDSWNVVTKKFLEEEYKKLSSIKYSTEKLYMHYWTKKIINTKYKFLKEHPNF
ncbi:hypothetical protein H0X06_02660 [Candidatus Dependentiae bacterium]|nr:hypothetical protein [Candidatus Dependentiae bacterium]